MDWIELNGLVLIQGNNFSNYAKQGDEEVKKNNKTKNIYLITYYLNLYFSASLIVLIQVYNWEIRHHSLVCCCGLADILYIM